MPDKNISTIAKDFERKIDETFELWFNKKMNRKDAINILECAKGEYERNVPKDSRKKSLLEWYVLWHYRIKHNIYDPYIGP